MFADELLYIGKPLNLTKGTLVITSKVLTAEASNGCFVPQTERTPAFIYYIVWSLEGEDYVTTCSHVDLTAIQSGFRVYYYEKEFEKVEIVSEKWNMKLPLVKSILQVVTDPQVAASRICLLKHPKPYAMVGNTLEWSKKRSHNGWLVITWQENQYSGCYHLAYLNNGQTWALYNQDIYDRRYVMESIHKHGYHVTGSVVDDSICICTCSGYVIKLPRI